MILKEYENHNRFCLGLDPGLIDIVHVRNQDGKFEFVIKSTEFRNQACGNHAKKKTDEWRDKAKLVEIDNCQSMNHSRVTTVQEYNIFLVHEHVETPKDGPILQKLHDTMDLKVILEFLG